MNQFQSTEDIRIFCGFLIQLATDIGDEKARLLLQEALAAGNTSSPTERLGETIEGLLVVREIMLRDDRYPVDVIYEVNEAIKMGQKMLRRANRPWFFLAFPHLAPVVSFTICLVHFPNASRQTIAFEARLAFTP